LTLNSTCFMSQLPHPGSLLSHRAYLSTFPDLLSASCQLPRLPFRAKNTKQEYFFCTWLSAFWRFLPYRCFQVSYWYCVGRIACRKWGTGSPGGRWTSIAHELFREEYFWWWGKAASYDEGESTSSYLFLSEPIFWEDLSVDWVSVSWIIFSFCQPNESTIDLK